MFLAVDDVRIAAFVGARSHRGCIGARLRFGNADCGLVTVEHELRGHPLLGIGAVGHYGRNRTHVRLDDDSRGDCAGLRHFFDHQNGVEEGATLAAKRLRNCHAAKARLAQRFDDVPRILLVTVGCRRPRPHNLGRKGAGALTQREFVGRKAQVHVHGGDHKCSAGRSLQVNQPLGLTFYCSTMSSRTNSAHLLASAAVAVVLALSAGGCSNFGPREATGSVGGENTASLSSDRGSLEPLGARYRQNPDDPDAAIAYARELRANDQRAQAVAVLEQASIRNPRSMALLGAYGRALADVGQYQQALATLERAHTPDNPDWRILNVQGAVLDQMGRHAEAQRHYASALKIRPNEASVLSNLGLSYMLTKDLKNAEATLRRAIAQPDAGPKVRQNLALVVGLLGRFEEAEKIASADLPESEAAANVAYLRQMLAQKGDWKKMGRAYGPAPGS